MFTDLAGFTELTQKDERGALALVAELDRLSAPIIQRNQGRKVKSIGDGLLVEFPNALQAVECAVELQLALHERNASADARPLRLRVGLHLGDVERRGDDILGDAVNLASRLEPLAEPGGVCLSEQVVVQVRNKLPYPIESAGSRNLKGIQDPVGIYRVVLPWTSPARSEAAGGPPRLAVLPLSNISPDPRDEYLADGLTEELIAVLSRIRGLRVIARTSVSQYKTAPKPIRQVGSELSVGSILEGSVRRAGERLRITLQLIDASTEEHRWAETYDRELRDIFEIQAEIAERTAAALRVELLGGEREALRQASTSNLEAYELYLRGLVAFNRTADEGWSPRGVEETARLYEAAVAKDPKFAAAHAAFANLLIAAMGETMPMSQVTDRIRQLVDTAVQLGPDESEAHTARGNYALQLEMDWSRAESEFRKAIELNPSSMPAHAWFGIALISLGRFQEARRELEAAVRLDPLFRQVLYWLCRALVMCGDGDRAVELLEALCKRDPADRSAQVHLAVTYMNLGRKDEARRAIDASQGPLLGVAPMTIRAQVRAMLGDPSEARALVRAWEEKTGPDYIRPSYIASIYAVLGEKEKALDLLEYDYREGDRSFWIDFRRAEFEPLRNEPRFRALVKAMNLPD